MTVPVIKIKVLPKPVIKGKMDARFPANVATTNFLTVTKSNGTYTFGVDYTLLSEFTQLDPTTAKIAFFDAAQGVYKIISVSAVFNSSLDVDLQAIAALTGTGLLARTASGTWALRSLTAPAAGFAITNPDGVAGNPTFALANDLAALEGLGSTGIAVRTAAETWAQRSIAGPAAGITVSNGDGVAGNPTLALANDLAAVEGLSGTGIARRTGADAWSVGTAVANGELATMANNTFKGNVSGSTAVPADLTPAQVTAALPVATTSAKGLAPVLPNDATKYLDGTGNYTAPGVGGLSPAERAYWVDQAALLDPAAYVFWKGVFNVTVPAGETWYVVNAWATKIQGSDQWYHRDLGIDECFPITAGTTISTIGIADCFLYVCRPALVTSDAAYSDPKGLYYTRLNALRAIVLSQVSATQAAGAAAGTSTTTNFPFDFNDGILAQMSTMDSAWTILLDALAKGALNSSIEISDRHQFRPTKKLLTPFRRAMFPAIQCQGGSVSGNATDTIVGGSGVVSYYKLPDTFRTQSPLNAYRAAVLADTPRIYYTFDEVSGTVANDAGSVGLNGAYFGSVVLGLPGATSDGRYSVGFNASNEGVSIPGSTNFDFAGGDFTYEAWIKFDALPTPTAGADIYVINAWQTDASSPISTLLGVSNNKFKFYVMVTGSVTVSVSSTISLGLAQYYHVIAGRSGGNLFIRVVSKETRQTAAISANIIARGSNAVWLGTGNTGAAYVAALTGRIDEFALYNFALSDARADAHHAAQIGW